MIEKSILLWKCIPLDRERAVVLRIQCIINKRLFLHVCSRPCDECPGTAFVTSVIDFPNYWTVYNLIQNNTICILCVMVKCFSFILPYHNLCCTHTEPRLKGSGTQLHHKLKSREWFHTVLQNLSRELCV